PGCAASRTWRCSTPRPCGSASSPPASSPRSRPPSSRPSEKAFAGSPQGFPSASPFPTPPRSRSSTPSERSASVAELLLQLRSEVPREAGNLLEARHRVQSSLVPVAQHAPRLGHRHPQAAQVLEGGRSQADMVVPPGLLGADGRFGLRLRGLLELRPSDQLGLRVDHHLGLRFDPPLGLGFRLLLDL